MPKLEGAIQQVNVLSKKTHFLRFNDTTALLVPCTATGMYDDFATRDSNGGLIFSHLYPYFSSPASKPAVLSGQPVPVQSCWHGIGNFQIPKVILNR